MAEIYRGNYDREPPPPAAPSQGLCRQCDHRATRLVRYGVNEPVAVCLWHSLVAQQMRHAHLVRDLATASP
jgi:hypothetical protein